MSALRFAPFFVNVFKGFLRQHYSHALQFHARIGTNPGWVVWMCEEAT